MSFVTHAPEWWDWVWPQTQQAHFNADNKKPVRWPRTITYHADKNPLLNNAWRRLNADFQAAGKVLQPVAPSRDTLIVLERKEHGPAQIEDPDRETFSILHHSGNLFLIATSELGWFRAIQQLAAMVRAGREVLQSHGGLQEFAVFAHPEFPTRGVCLDISRGKVPTLNTLRETIDGLARFHVNHLQLYTEHTFAYQGHETVWRDASPLTGDDIDQLHTYCAQRGMRLVANQNSLGHFHRWLVHEPYRALAEVPEGFSHPFSFEPEPFSLCPTDPAALDLLRDLYGQLLPHFESPLVNVGLDETMDLGQGRSKEICAAKGKTAVYLDFLNQVNDLLKEHGKRMMFWGDILIEEPRALERVPRDAVALEWGYEADHPFAEHCKHYRKSGLTYWLCPGTSSWSSLAGRVGNALVNLQRACAEGLEQRAAGIVVTDWGDYGHWQTPPVAWPGLMAGAGLAWLAMPLEEDIELAPWAERLSRHCDPFPTLEHAWIWLELGELYRVSGAKTTNGSALFFLIRFADADLNHPRLGGLTEAGLIEVGTALDGLAARISKLPPAEEHTAYLDWTRRMLSWCVAFGRARFQCGADQPVAALPSETKQVLRDDLHKLATTFARLWPGRFRPGGLDVATAGFARLQRLLN
ncbi:beta-N-acetylhexosaminidase [Acanthopleuribacter pedis]|uniref:beta-N-acetylhexosaminidase n=1 Tax=Acanthopleuribacter pedis TaxID=442870 RepID=A0A8J7QAH7_9BACT|nr:beta-N-acetylhexosaminidase [Acanthopleuribacter pedis]MBO1320059.1 beta-N-acetylhexosaminidase [Acanthopleuribacter pedis]